MAEWKEDKPIKSAENNHGIFSWDEVDVYI